MAKSNDPLHGGLRQKFGLGYRNREDVSVLPPDVLVTGSKNVLTNTFMRVGNRKGYVLDGQRDTSNSGAGIYGAFDWQTHIGTERNIKVGFNTTGTNGQALFRYVAAAGDYLNGTTFTAGQVYWVSFQSGLGSRFNACRFWDFNNELKDLMLFVDGTPNIYVWSGGVTTLKARTANTLTLNSSGTWESNGFLGTATYDRKVTINGTVYTYTGGSGTATLTGVTPDPSAEPLNSVVFQTPTIVPNSSMSGIPAAFKNNIIENLNNQIYVSATDNNSVYVSKENSFTDYTFGTPRATGEGAILTLDAVPTVMRQQSDSMFISAGRNYWYQTEFKLSSTNAEEALEVKAIKTTANQAARTQALSAKIKNLLAFVSFETQINTVGISANFFTDPQVSDLSFPIVNDVINADFTDGQVLYFRKFLFVTAPKESLMFIYNMTQDVTDGLVDTNSTHYWEAPQTLPVGRLSIIGGELYGHDYSSGNTYKLFTGYNDDGKPYNALALFSYDTHGDRTATKSSNEFFLEGYKTQSTKLTGYLRRGLNGPVSRWSWSQLPDRFLVIPVDDASIGKSPIGEVPIGSSNNVLTELNNPPKFRLVQTFDRSPYFEEQIGFGSNGIDQRWEIVSYATNATLTTEGNPQIYDPPLA